MYIMMYNTTSRYISIYESIHVVMHMYIIVHIYLSTQKIGNSAPSGTGFQRAEEERYRHVYIQVYRRTKINTHVTYIKIDTHAYYHVYYYI